MTGRRIYRSPWRVDLTIRAGVPAVVGWAELARAVEAALAAARAPSPASIGLILSDDAELSGLNTTHMGKGGPTDVLSFPLLPASTYPPHEGSAAADDRTAQAPEAFVLPPGVRPHLGDVVVSVERAISQAEAGRGGWTGDVRWSPADELRLLVVHGTLHVCGWDHAQPEERAAMRQLEASLLGRATPR